jgi:uncharacterized protein (TIGR02466 family)
MEKVSVLPQTIYRFKSTPELLKDTQIKVVDLQWQNNGNNSISLDYFLNKKIEFQNLHNWFYECLLEVKNELNYIVEDIKITQSWANLNLKGQSHHPHKHPNSMLSGVYYLTDCNVGTRFFMQNIWGNFNGDQSSVCIFDLLPNYNSVITHIENEKPGTLVIFPSTLPHSVDSNMGENPRYTISFNSFPSGNIGNFDNLDGVLLEVK